MLKHNIEFRITKDNAALIEAVMLDILSVHYPSSYSDNIDLADFIDESLNRGYHYFQIWKNDGDITRFSFIDCDDPKAVNSETFHLVKIDFTLEEYLSHYRSMVLLGWLPPLRFLDMEN